MKEARNPVQISFVRLLLGFFTYFGRSLKKIKPFSYPELLLSTQVCVGKKGVLLWEVTECIQC